MNHRTLLLASAFHAIFALQAEEIPMQTTTAAVPLTTPQTSAAEGHAQAWSGKNYSKNSALQYNFNIKALTDYPLSGTEHILDLGCGDGGLTAHLAALVPYGRVVGSDCSGEMIAFAQSSYAPLRHNLSFTTSYVEDITYENEFDVVTSFCMLQWVPDLSKALANICKALKPGGRTLLFIPQVTNSPMQTEIYATVDSLKWQSFFENKRPVRSSIPLTVDFVHKLCSENKLDVTSADCSLMCYTFPNDTAYINWFKALPWINAIPVDLQSEFCADLVARLRTYSQATDTTCPVYINFITIKATKPF